MESLACCADVLFSGEQKADRAVSARLDPMVVPEEPILVSTDGQEVAMCDAPSVERDVVELIAIFTLDCPHALNGHGRVAILVLLQREEDFHMFTHASMPSWNLVALRSV